MVSLGQRHSTLDTSVNGYLVNTGSKLVRIDAGAAGLVGPTLGNLLTNLKAAGYQPEQVDEVYITHMHADHVGGLMNGDKRAFPNATVRADQHDADFWLSLANLDKAPADATGFFQGAVTIQFDTASKRAALQRKRAYADAAKQGNLVGSAHVSFPGLGHLRAQGKGYEWLPVNYSGLK